MPVSPKLRLFILERDGFTCHYCGSVGDASSMVAEHKIPFSAGGPDTADNLVAACAPCNYRKATMSYEDFKAGKRRPKKKRIIDPNSLFLSIRQASTELRMDRRTVHGFAWGMNIRLTPLGKSLLMSRADLRRLKARIDQCRSDDTVTV